MPLGVGNRGILGAAGVSVAAPGPGDASSDYDGTNDYATRGADLTGAADGKAGLISFWIRLDGGDSTNTVITRTDSPLFFVTRAGTNVFTVFARETGNTTILDVDSASSYTVASPGGWIHFLCSWDLATPEVHMYINDTEDADTPGTLTDDTIDYTSGDWGIGANPAGGTKFNGCISEYYFEDTFLDISVEANRRKFISATGKPVDLGADGSTPTSAQPLIYAPDGDPSDNKGTGGNFTITGSLTACSSDPID